MATNTNRKGPAKKTAAKKTAAKKAPAAKKSAPKKTAKKKSAAIGGQSLPRVMNEHGLVVGSEGEKIMNVLLEGGFDRVDVNNKALKAIGKKQTIHGNPPNVSSLISNLLKRMLEKGYTIDSHWVLVPPTPASKAAATKAKKKAAQKAQKPSEDEAPAKSAAKKATAKKAPAAKKVAKRPAKK